MMNRFSEEEAQAIATLVTALRPGWDHRGIMSALARVADRADPITVAMAVLAIAQDPNVKTPGLLAFDGPHWQRATAPGRTSPIRPAAPVKDTSPDCEAHPGVKAWECKACEVRASKPANFDDLLRQAAEAARAERGIVHV